MTPEEIVARAMFEAANPGEKHIRPPEMRALYERCARAAIRALEEAGWKLYPPGQSSPRPRAMLAAARVPEKAEGPERGV